jgi:diacylglycerol kinase family enzyme
MHLIPEATIDDGLIDVVVLHPRGFWSWLLVIARVLSKDRREDDAINRMQGRSISVRVAHDIPRQIDGDPIGPGKEMHCECVHGQLLVRVPR